MKKVLSWFFGILLLLLGILYFGASWFFSTVVLASETNPITAETLAKAEEDLAVANIPMPEEVSIEGADGVTLAGYFHDNPQDAGCGMVVLHGYTGTAYGMSPFVPMFWALGCEVISYDARGHGNSDEAFHTFGYYEREDASAVVDWLAAETGLSPSQIGLIGVSYGAATSIQTLDVRSDLAFVIADSSYQDYFTIVSYQAEQRYGEWIRFLVASTVLLSEWRANFEIDEVSPQNIIQDTSVPVLLIHAREDNYTFASHSENIFAKANPESTVLEITDWGNGHGNSRSTRPEEYQEIVYAFIDAYAPNFK